jgi:hypothetical protein
MKKSGTTTDIHGHPRTSLPLHPPLRVPIFYQLIRINSCIHQIRKIALATPKNVTNLTHAN